MSTVIVTPVAALSSGLTRRCALSAPLAAGMPRNGASVGGTRDASWTVPAASQPFAAARTVAGRDRVTVSDLADLQQKTFMSVTPHPPRGVPR